MKRKYYIEDDNKSILFTVIPWCVYFIAMISCIVLYAYNSELSYLVYVLFSLLFISVITTIYFVIEPPIKEVNKEEFFNYYKNYSDSDMEKLLVKYNKSKVISRLIFIIIIIAIGVGIVFIVSSNNSKNDVSDENKNNSEKEAAYKCAKDVAKKYELSSYCTEFKEVSDGFYNYECGSMTIRVLKNEDSMTYDIYNSTTSTYEINGTCNK